MCRADMPAASVPRPGPVAALNCLLLHYGVPDEVLPVAERPSLVLSAESELGITAGLQDRVIQVCAPLLRPAQHNLDDRIAL